MAMSCSPKVISDIRISYPVTTEPQDVVVLGPQSAVPESAERLGSVRITDSGFTLECSYEEVLDKARRETSRWGGNLLHIIAHRRPDLWSTCHRIKGDIWLVHKSTEEESIVRDSAAPLAAASPLPSYAPTRGPGDNVQRHPSNTIYACIGFGGLLNKFANNVNIDSPPNTGLSWEAGYQWVSKKGYGAGFRYSGYRSSYRFGEGKRGPHFYKARYYLHYIGPEFVMKGSMGKNWLVTWTIGAGYSVHRETVQNTAFSVKGFGLHTALEIDCRLHDNIGIGCGFTNVLSVHSMSGIPEAGMSAEGVNRLGFHIGLKVFF